MFKTPGMLQEEKQKTLTSEQVTALVLALEGYDPWIKLMPKQEHTISVDITLLEHSVGLGQWGINMDFAITDKAKYAKDSTTNYNLYIGYFETLTQTNPGILSLSTYQEGELVACVLANVGYATDLLRQWGIWDDHQEIIDYFAEARNYRI